MLFEILRQPEVLQWTDLSAMTYLVPLVIAALAAMFYGAADNLASHAGYRCIECGAKFEDISVLNRHLKGKVKEKLEFRKIA